MPVPAISRLTLALLRRGDLTLARSLAPARRDLGATRRAFECSAPERRFAWALLERKTNLWLLRTDQRGFSGDFVVLDLSSPRLDDRPVLVLELKQGAALREVGPTRHQVQNAAAAVAAAARLTGAIAPDAAFRVLLGDPDALLEHLAA